MKRWFAAIYLLFSVEAFAIPSLECAISRYTTVPTEKQKVDVIRKAHQSYLLAEKHFGRKFDMARIEIMVPLDETDAGLTFLKRNLIVYNSLLLVKYQREYIDEVVPHEVAHSVVYQLGDRSTLDGGHGPIWKAVMVAMGASKIRKTHTFKVCDEDIG